MAPNGHSASHPEVALVWHQIVRDNSLAATITVVTRRVKWGKLKDPKYHGVIYFLHLHGSIYLVFYNVILFDWMYLFLSAPTRSWMGWKWVNTTSSPIEEVYRAEKGKEKSQQASIQQTSHHHRHHHHPCPRRLRHHHRPCLHRHHYCHQHHIKLFTYYCFHF